MRGQSKSDDSSAFRDHDPPIPVTVDTCETRRRKTSPKVTTVLRCTTGTPPIPVTVVTFETRRCEASRKVTTVLHFATTTPPIPVTDTFEMRNVKRNDSSTFRDDFRLSGKSDASPKFRERCERLRTINATTSRRLLDPWTATLKGTLLLRIREKSLSWGGP